MKVNSKTSLQNVGEIVVGKDSFVLIESNWKGIEEIIGVSSSEHSTVFETGAESGGISMVFNGFNNVS